MFIRRVSQWLKVVRWLSFFLRGFQQCLMQSFHCYHLLPIFPYHSTQWCLRLLHLSDGHKPCALFWNFTEQVLRDHFPPNISVNRNTALLMMLLGRGVPKALQRAACTPRFSAGRFSPLHPRVYAAEMATCF